jgi:hypothetical protein
VQNTYQRATCTWNEPVSQQTRPHLLYHSLSHCCCCWCCWCCCCCCCFMCVDCVQNTDQCATCTWNKPVSQQTRVHLLYHSLSHCCSCCCCCCFCCSMCVDCVQNSDQRATCAWNEPVSQQTRLHLLYHSLSHCCCCCCCCSVCVDCVQNTNQRATCTWNEPVGPGDEKLVQFRVTANKTGTFQNRATVVTTMPGVANQTATAPVTVVPPPVSGSAEPTMLHACSLHVCSADWVVVWSRCISSATKAQAWWDNFTRVLPHCQLTHAAHTTCCCCCCCCCAFHLYRLTQLHPSASLMLSRRAPASQLRPIRSSRSHSQPACRVATWRPWC